MVMEWVQKAAVVGVAALIGWFGGDAVKVHTAPKDPEAIVELKPAFMKLDGCSGVYIGKNRVLTAAHCINAIPDNYEKLWRSPRYDVMMLEWTGEGDLPRKSAELACRPTRIGEEVSAITFPSFGANVGVIGAVHTRGYVAGLTTSVLQWKKTVPLNLSAAPGSSGGAVFDADKRLLGLVVGGPNPFGNMTLMVPSSTICHLLAR